MPTPALLWLLGAVIVYVYLGYPALVFILSKLRPVLSVQTADITPTVSLVIAAYNEEKTIAQKLENSLALEYPRERLEIVVASDGSTDGTNGIVSTFTGHGVKLVTMDTNQGKSSAQNRAVAQAQGEILFFTDADVMLQPDAVRKVVRSLGDECVGCVISKIVYANVGDTSVGQGEGAYWRYELLLRRLESAAGNLAMGSGSMAIRRGLFRPLGPDVGEDFVLPIQAAMSGYRVIYEPEAVSETSMHQTRDRDMLRTKSRVITKDLRGLFLCRAILNPFRYPLYAWGLISHKLLRWLVPYFLVALFALNLLLLEHPFYRLALVLQVAFYGLAAAGYLWQRRGKPPRILGIPFSFCLVNAAALVGIARFVMGKRAGKWTPIRGSPPQTG